MISRKAFRSLLFAICTLLVLCIPVALFQEQAKAVSDLSCSKAVSGAYVTTITDASGAFASRSVLTISEDGNLFNIDSRVDGGGLFNPFTNAHGTWKCIKKDEIVGRAINWILRTDPVRSRTEETSRLGLIDYKNIKFDFDNQTIEGVFDLRFFNIKTNPLDKNAVPDRFVGTFSLKGQRLNAD